MSPFVTAARGTAAARVAVVTDAAGGVGRRVALRLADDGYDVVLAHSGDRPAAERVRSLIEERAGRALMVDTDVALEAAVQRLFEQTEAAFGAVDVVVNAAEVVVRGPLGLLPPEEFDRMHRTNVHGAFLVGRHAAQRMRRGGSLVNLSSSVTLPVPLDLEARVAYSAYAVGKSAVNALTMVLARELRGRDVTVNAIAPDPGVVVRSGSGAAELDDIAETVALLVGAGHRLSGQILYVGSGPDQRAGC